MFNDLCSATFFHCKGATVGIALVLFGLNYDHATTGWCWCQPSLARLVARLRPWSMLCSRHSSPSTATHRWLKPLTANPSSGSNRECLSFCPVGRKEDRFACKIQQNMFNIKINSLQNCGRMFSLCSRLTRLHFHKLFISIYVFFLLGTTDNRRSSMQVSAFHNYQL